MDKPTVIRRVRIAMSVFFGVLTVALCVLWVRSHWWSDAFYSVLPCDYQLEINLYYGTAMFSAKWLPTANWPISLHVKEPLTTSWRDLPDYPIFMFAISGRDVFVRFPYWFMVTVSASVTAIFTFRQCSSFSLQSLFVATTLFAVVARAGLLCFPVMAGSEIGHQSRLLRPWWVHDCRCGIRAT